MGRMTKKMKNKILIKLIVPEIDCSFDVIVPVNEIIWKIEKLILKSVNDLSGGSLDINKNYILFNKSSGLQYKKNSILIDTDIRNATELVLISVK